LLVGQFELDKWMHVSMFRQKVGGVKSAGNRTDVSTRDEIAHRNEISGQGMGDTSVPISVISSVRIRRVPWFSNPDEWRK